MRFYTLVLSLFLLALPIIPAQAASAPPILPAASVFILPSASVGGTPTVSTSKISSPFDISSPGAAYCRGQTTIESDYAVAQSPINYTIRQLPSTSAASCVDMAQQHVLLSSYAPLVASQGLPGEWIRGAVHNVHSEIWTGIVFRNLELLASIDSDYAANRKNQAVRQALNTLLTVEQRLLGRAQAFAAHPFKTPPPAPAPPTTPSLTPAQQDRNAAMRSLVTQINDVLDPCRAGFSIVSNDVQDLINKSGSVATTDGDAYNALSPCDAAGTTLEGLTPPNVLKGYASIHTLIQQEAKVTRTYVNYLILVKADMDDAMNGRAPIGTASDFTKASDVAKAQDQQGIDLMHQIDQAWHYSS